MPAPSFPTPYNTGEPCVLGIDEAGRGPVLGPLVYASACCALSSLDSVTALGVDDSKQLNEGQRAVLRARLDAAGAYLRQDEVVLHADELSAQMLRPNRVSLNEVSHNAALALVRRALDEGIDVAEVYVDTVGSPEAYRAKFVEAFPQVRKVVVAKKADATYQIVGAASIVAKTTRDHVVEGWKFAEEARGCEGGADRGVQAGLVSFSRDYGSGYPSDPKTREWLKMHLDPLFGYPSFARFSWGTVKKILDSEGFAVTWACDEEEDEGRVVPACKLGKSLRVAADVNKTKPNGNIKRFFAATPPGAGSEINGKWSKVSRQRPRQRAAHLRRFGLKEFAFSVTGRTV